MNIEGKIFIVVGPSGVGKSSLVGRVVSELDQLYDVITSTTRPMREGEREGFPYFFLSSDEFESLKSCDYFVEFARVHNQWYGTPRSEIEGAWAKGLSVIMDVDVQGADALKEKYPQAVTLFILPPSLDALRCRVESRDGSQLLEEDLKLRMSNAVKEIERASDFDYQFINESFEISYASFKKVIEDHLVSN